MTARRPADIAADLRRIAKAKPLYTVETVGTLTEAADILDRWPTADEIGEMAHTLRRIAHLLAYPDRGDLIDVADRLDPPQPEPLHDDDVVAAHASAAAEWWRLRADALADDLRNAVDNGYLGAATERLLSVDHDAARAALDARGPR